MQEIFEININPEESLIPAVCKAISTAAGRYFDEKSDLFQIENAVEEALGNVILYSKSKELKKINISVETGDGEFTVSVFDTGLPGDYNETLKDEERFGLDIMSGLMDKVSVINNGKDGRCQQLVKYYSKKKDVAVSENNTEEQIITDTQITIRQPKKQDMLNICRKLYGEYGLTYPHAEIYYPEQFYASIKKDEIHSIIAVDENGNIAGHHASWEWSDLPGVWESGMAVVDRRYRGQGIFDKMMAITRNYVVNEAKASLYISCAATTHSATQKVRLKYGDSPCGFMFNALNSSTLRGSFTQFNDRPTSALAYSAFDKTEKTVYLPEEIKKISDIIYAPQELRRSVITDSKNVTVTTGKTIISSIYREDDLCGDIYVRSTGADYMEKLHEIYIDLKNKDTKTISLYINGDEPGAIPMYEYAKRLGFFFTGLLPCTDFGDMLLMQKILSGTIHYDHIITIGPFTEMMEMIHQLDPDNCL